MSACAAAMCTNQFMPMRLTHPPTAVAGISWEDACARRDEAVQRMAAAEGEDHKHASGFYMGEPGLGGEG